MDDTAQKQNPKGQTQIVPTGSSLNKELGSVSDFASHSEQEPRIERELKEAGVEAVPETPKLTEIHEKIGVKLSPQSSKPNLEKTLPSSVFPMTQASAEQIVKTDKNIKDSIVWFAALMMKMFKKVGGGADQKVN